MNCIAVIPARGGSKGIPRKNLTMVGGLPLVQWSIMHAWNASLVDKVIVTTDDDEIARLAEQSGAAVVRRDGNEALSGDNATTEAAILHALDDCDIDDSGTWVLTLQPTSPLRGFGLLDEAIRYAYDHQARYDSLFSARLVDGYCWRQRGRLHPEPIETGPRERRQERTTKILEENGSFYITKLSMLRGMRDRLAGRVGYYLMDPMDSFQIDEPSDLSRLEAMMHVRMPQILAEQQLSQRLRERVA